MESAHASGQLGDLVVKAAELVRQRKECGERGHRPDKGAPSYCGNCYEHLTPPGVYSLLSKSSSLYG